MTEFARWKVPGCDGLGRHKPSVVTINEHGHVVLLAPPPGALIVDPETEFDHLISALNDARSLARSRNSHEHH